MQIETILTEECKAEWMDDLAVVITMPRPVMEMTPEEACTFAAEIIAAASDAESETNRVVDGIDPQSSAFDELEGLSTAIKDRHAL